MSAIVALLGLEEGWVEIVDQRLVGALLLVALLAARSFFDRVLFVFVLLRLPSTILHEISHWLVALVLGGRPSLPSFWPSWNGRGWTLGAVEFSPSLLSAAPAALAPVLYLFPAFSLLGSTSPEWWYFLAGFLLIEAGTPSRVDFSLLLRNPLSVAFWLVAVVAAVKLAIYL